MRFRFESTILAVVVLTTALLAGCGEEESPVGNSSSIQFDDILASYTGTGSMSSSQPPQEATASAIIEFGVESDPPDNTTDYPEPLLFGENVMVEGDRIVYQSNTDGFDITAQRLTDGVDETTYVSISVQDRGKIGSGGHESTLFDYPESVHRDGPDLHGHEVTSISVSIDRLTTSHPGALWETEYNFTVQIHGK